MADIAEQEHPQSRPDSPGTSTSCKKSGSIAPSECRSPSPRPASQSAAINRRSRKNSVQMACERCRRRKIKCSGLPGPCATCASLGTVCHDPVKRKDRAQSVLENRIQRLEALAAQGRAASHSEGMTVLPYRPPQHPQPPFIAQPVPRQALHIQTDNLSTYSGSETLTTNYNPQSFNANWEFFTGSTSPACYSDAGPDLAPWVTVDYEQPGSDVTVTPSNPSLHKRSHTFPNVTTDGFDWTQDNEAPLSACAFSDIPSIEVTSPDCSRPQSPFNLSEHQDLSPPGIAIAYSDPTLDQADEEYEQQFELPRTPPLCALNTQFQDNQIDYYGDFLSPVDKPPTLSRRSSMASSPGTNVHPEQSPVLGTRLHRSQTLPSTLNQPFMADQERLNTTVNSPRTRNYLQIYFQQVHPQCPMLNPAIFSPKAPTNYITTYQVLLAAGIGALIHHQSRSLSSPYVRLAMSFNNEIDFWSSISGVHCALLLAIYCMYEETLIFKDEIDLDDPHQLPLSQPLHPRVNLWLHCCQICTTCIDLGLNLGYLSGPEPLALPQGKASELEFFPETASEIEMEVVFRNTFRVAYGLDKRVSALKQRPRAIRDETLDIGLYRNYMLENAVL